MLCICYILYLVLRETRPDDTCESDWGRLNIIRSCLAKEHRYTFLQEKSTCSLWKALENKHMKKRNVN